MKLNISIMQYVSKPVSTFALIMSPFPFFLLYRSDSSFSFFFFFFVFFFQVAVYIIQTVGIPHWGNRSVGFIYLFIFSYTTWKCGGSAPRFCFSSVWMCMLLWDTFSVHGPPHFFIHTCVCVWILLLSLLYCISLTDSCCPNKSGLLLCKCV